MILSKKSFFVVFFVSLFLSGCASLGGGNKSGPGEEITGNGVDFDLNLNTNFLPTISYDVSLKNQGRENIDLSYNGILVRTNGLEGGSDILSLEDINEFNEGLFRGANILYSAQEMKSAGSFRVQDDFYQDLTNDGFDLEIEFSYPYKTEFYSQIEIDLLRFEIDYSKISQAAPLKISDVKLLPLGDGFKLLFYLDDSGSSFSSRTEVYLRGEEFSLGTQRLSCSPFYMDGQTPQKIEGEAVLNKDNTNLVYACDFDEEQFRDGPISTQFSGEISYDYRNKIFERVRFPQKRTSGFE